MARILGAIIAAFLLLAVPELALAQAKNQPTYGTVSGNAVNGQQPVDVAHGMPNALVGPGGNTATVSLDGALSVNTPPNPQFTDLFSAALDTTTNWTTNNSGGTTATSAGSLVISGTTTASQYAGLSTKQSWAPAGISPQIFGVAVVYNTLAVTNSVRIFGVYTSPGTPTLAAPITDGYVFRMDATGALFAEVWAAGAAVASSNITAVAGCAPVAGIPNLYYVSFRTNQVQFGCGTNPSAFITFVNPANQTLPISAYSIAGLSNPGSAATMTLTGLSLSSQSGASVKAAGQAATVNDSATVVTFSPNSAQPIPASGSGIAPVVSGSSASGLILKASAGSLFGVYANSTASVYLMVFNSATVPSNGATTAGIAAGNMLQCIGPSQNPFIDFPSGVPEPYSTGISAAISSTPCATLTLSATAFIHGRVQ